MNSLSLEDVGLGRTRVERVKFKMPSLIYKAKPIPTSTASQLLLLTRDPNPGEKHPPIRTKSEKILWSESGKRWISVLWNKPKSIFRVYPGNWEQVEQQRLYKPTPPRPRYGIGPLVPTPQASTPPGASTEPTMAEVDAFYEKYKAQFIAYKLTPELWATLTLQQKIAICRNDVKWVTAGTPMPANPTAKILYGIGEDEEPSSDRVMIQPKAGEAIRSRGDDVDAGEVYVSRRGHRKAWPYTPSNDERSLPKAGGEPSPILPIQRFPGSYPHGWIDYEKMRQDVSTEMGPVPSGWEEPIYVSDETAATKEWAMPSPWTAPEMMSRDVSGWGSGVGRFHDFLTAQTYAQSRNALSGLGQEEDYGYNEEGTPTPVSQPSEEIQPWEYKGSTETQEQAATQTIAKQAQDAKAQAAAQGASTFDIAKIVNTVISGGSQVAASVISAQATKKAAKAGILTTAVSAVKTTATKAAATGASLLSNPIVLVGGLAVLGLGAYAAFGSGGSGGGGRSRSRRSTRRRR
jgi:hypothetical protein